MDTFSWLRYNDLIVEQLLRRADEDEGDIEKARKAGRTFLTILHRNEGLIRDAIADPDGPPLPVRFHAVTLENDPEQRVQFDSVGYSVRLPSILALQGLLRLTHDDLAIMEMTARYLDARKYWRKPDEGIWEEDMQLHNSSRGVAISGLGKMARVFDAHHHRAKVDLSALIGRGQEVFRAIWRYGETPPHSDYPGRFYDASHMVLAEGIRLFGRNFVASDVLVTRSLALVGEVASKRYFGDTYNATGFAELFEPSERTSQGEGRQELRDSLVAETLENHSEAQWPLPEGYHSSYRGRRAEWSHDSDDLMAQLLFLNRNLGQYITTPEATAYTRALLQERDWVALGVPTIIYLSCGLRRPLWVHWCSLSEPPR